MGLLFAFFIHSAAGARGDEKRIALVIGNSAYDGAAALQAPAKDAEAIGQALIKVGFNIDLVLDADEETILRAVDGFLHAAREADVSLFFYAGHTVRAGTALYLTPIRLSPTPTGQLKDRLVSVSHLSSELGLRQRRQPKILIVDTGFSNAPTQDYTELQSQVFEFDRYAAANETQFLARMRAHIDPPSSEAPSYFARELASRIANSRLGLMALLLETMGAVRRATKGEQMPWIESTASDDFYFTPIRASIRQ